MNELRCPECDHELVEQPYAKIHMATCFHCRGSWYRGETLAKLLSLKKNRDLLNFSKDLFEEKESERNCPQCHCHLTAKTFKNRDGLTIDQCTQCQGVWLDAGEFANTKTFVREYFGEKHREEKKQKKLTKKPAKLGYKHSMRLYPVPKLADRQRMPNILKKVPSFELDWEVNEIREEQNLIEGTAVAEATPGIWAFTILTGMPVEAYNPPRRNFPFVVSFLIIINFIIHLCVQSMPYQAQLSFFREFGAVPGTVLGGHHLLTLLSYAFLHGGWMHLIGNMYFVVVWR